MDFSTLGGEDGPNPHFSKSGKNPHFFEGFPNFKHFIQDATPEIQLTFTSMRNFCFTIFIFNDKNKKADRKSINCFYLKTTNELMLLSFFTCNSNFTIQDFRTYYLDHF